MKAHKIFTFILFLYSPTIYTSDNNNNSKDPNTQTGFQQFQNDRETNIQEFTNHNNQQSTMPRSTDSTERLVSQLIEPETATANNAGGGAAADGGGDASSETTNNLQKTQYPVSQNNDGTFVVYVPEPANEFIQRNTNKPRYFSLKYILPPLFYLSDCLALASSGMYLHEKANNTCPDSNLPILIPAFVIFSFMGRLISCHCK